ncbi:MAG: peptide deformylase [Kiritimatiellae bacterium]|nr:peptide deformylase [Kiritimatiellia bacterium]MDD5520753.1 peptide deformylase [Kiritimatiellia bacterium]
MKYEITIYGNPVLRKKAIPVEKIDDSIKQLAKDMLDAMYRSNGLGLAAEQVGRTEAICIVDLPVSLDVDEVTKKRVNPGIKMPIIMCNPVITKMEGEQIGQEGCLSFPEIFVTIKRAATIGVKFMNMAGKNEILEVSGLLARTVQHEFDHLNGILLVNRMSTVQKLSVAGKLKKLKKMNKA